MIQNRKNKKRNFLKMIFNKNWIDYQLTLGQLFNSYKILQKRIVTQAERLKNKRIKDIDYKLENSSPLKRNRLKDIKYFNLIPNSRLNFLKKLLKKNKKISTKIKNLKLNEINADNFIFYLYLLLGIFISLSTFSLFTMNIISDNKSLKKDIESSMQKKSKIPEITLKLKQLRAQGKSISSDNEFVLNLIGNDKDISTLLYIVNQIANNNNVDIVELEPQKKINYKAKSNVPKNNIDNSAIIGPPSNAVETPSISVGNNQLTSLNSEINSEIDNNYLLTSKLERQFFNLKFRGYFVDSIQFVKDLEQLENIVIFEDFKLKRLQGYDRSPKSKVLFESKLSVFGIKATNIPSK